MRPLEKRQYKARLKAKEESMKIHVAECDRLRKENRRLRSIIEKFNKHGVNHRVCAECYHHYKGESEFDYCNLNGSKIENIYKHTCNVFTNQIEWLRERGG